MKEKKLTKKAIKKKERINKRKQFAAWSLAVRERDGHTCQICNIKAGEMTKNGKVVVLNAHHILAKEGLYSFLIFDINNGICLCQSCHRFSRVCSPHRQEFVFFVWFIQNRPEQYEYLKNKIVNNSNEVLNVKQTI